MAKVSVIVPVYNVEQYLRECLDSVVNQTLKDIEIICIDDGSTDGSGAILDEYAKNDERIKVIHQKNSGVGHSRNEGLKLAVSDYIFFLDSDDFIELNTLEKMYDKSKSLDLDICVCGGKYYYTQTGNFEIQTNPIDKRYLPKKEVFSSYDVKDTIFHLFVGWVWDKLYKRSLIYDNKLQFPSLSNTEDTSFAYSALILSNRISTIDEPLHIYRKNVATSISVTRETEPDAFIKAMELLKKYLKSKGLYKTFRTGYLNYFISFSKWHLDTISNEYKEDLYKKIKKFIQSNVDKKEKLLFIDSYIEDLYKNYMKYLTYHGFKNKIKDKDRYSFFEKIFSVKNSQDYIHKVITIFGIKIKFRKRVK